MFIYWILYWYISVIHIYSIKNITFTLTVFNVINIQLLCDHVTVITKLAFLQLIFSYTIQNGVPNIYTCGYINQGLQ